MATILQRKLGGAGLVVPSLGLGCMGMSEFYGAADQASSLETIRRAIELGITFLDTADMYGPFTNEELLGRAIKGQRDKIILATKFGNVRGADGSFKGISGKAEYVRKACEASLKRAPDQRAPDRVFVVDARPRGRGPADRAGARHRFCGVQPSGPRLPDRTVPPVRGHPGERLPPELAALPGRELPEEPGAR